MRSLSFLDRSRDGLTVQQETPHLFRALNLDKIDGLEDGWWGSEEWSIEDTSGSGNDLTAATMDGVGVKSDVHDVKPDATHVLIAENTLEEPKQNYG